MAEDTQGLTDELPELEGFALDPQIASPIDAAPVAPAPAMAAPTEAAPMLAMPAPPSQISSAELTNDILGGVDFDLPAPPSSMSMPKPVAPKGPSAPPAFKAPTALFGQSGGFGTSGLKAVPIAPKPLVSAPVPVAAAVAAPIAAAMAAVDTRSMMGDMGADSKDALRAALTADTPPASLPPELSSALFHLARVLIKKGIVTVDELIP